MKQAHRLSSKIFSILITFAMIFGMLPMYVSATEYPVITSGEEVTVTLDGVDPTKVIYKFVPEKSGDYVFYSYDNDHDTYGTLYDENMEELTRNDDGGEGTNFRISYYFTKGDTYYLGGRFFDTTRPGAFKMIVAEAVAATEIVLSEDGPISTLEGDHFYLNYELYPVYHIFENVTYSSDNENVVMLDDGNNCCVVGAGTATVTATTESGLTDSVVINAVASENIECDIGYTVVLEEYEAKMFKFSPDEDGYYGFYTYNNNGILTYSYCRNFEPEHDFYNDTTVADNNSRTEVYMEAGVIYYFFTSFDGGDSGSYDVKLEKLVPATGMGFAEESYSGVYGTTMFPEIVFQPSNAITEHITFTSSDEDILSFNDENMAELHSIGTVTVTAESESGFKDTCTVEVTDYPCLSPEKAITVQNSLTYNSLSVFRFIPDESGTYNFFSGGTFDTYANVYDNEKNMLSSNDDSGEEYNFSISLELEADNVYILEIMSHGNPTAGSYTVQVNMVDDNGNVIHDVDSYTYDEEYHYGHCNNCGESVTQAHSFDQDGLCVCGYKHSHSFSYTFVFDSHEAFCDSCGIVLSEAHNFDIYGYCVCGYFDHECVYEWNEYAYTCIEDYHISRCKICLVSEYMEHVFDDDSSHCTECGYTVHEHTSDDLGNDDVDHYGFCEICSVRYTEEHSFDESGVCTACGYIDHEHEYTLYEFMDNLYHQSYCTDCLKIGDVVEHSYDENGTCVCGYEILKGLKLGDILLENGQYLDTDGNVTDTEPVEWSAYFSDGILTLKDIKIKAEGIGSYGICYDGDLEIVLEGYAAFSSTDEDCIHISSGDLTIGGDGTLAIVSAGDYDGIDAAHNGDVTINSGTVIIHAVDHGIEAEERLTVNGGTVIINAGDDGCDTEDTTINGGEVYIYAEDNGIDTDDTIIINDGYINITTKDDCGLSSEEYITVNGGNITIDANTYGIYTNSNYYDDNIIRINGGTLDITSGEGAMISFIDIDIDPVMGEYEIIPVEENNYNNNIGVYAVGQDGEKLLCVYMSDEENSKPSKKIGSSWISTDRDLYEYTGKEINPAVTVTDPETGEILVKDKDYTISWSAEEMIVEGAYYAVIEGKGEYSGTNCRIIRIRKTFIHVGDVLMENGDYLATGENAVTDKKPNGGYAYYKDGVLELNNYSYKGQGYMYDDTYEYGSLIHSDFDLEILLNNTSELVGSVGENDGISVYGNVTIGGSGSLTLDSSYGIYSIRGSVNIVDGDIVVISEYDSVYASDGDFTVTGGKFIATSENGCLKIYGDVNISEGEVELIVLDDRIKEDNTAISASNINITGGSVSIDGMEAGISCDQSMTVEGGTLKISAKYGITVFGEFVMSDGIVEITGDYGICASDLVVFLGGYVNISCEKIAFEGSITDCVILHDGVELVIPENGEIRNYNGSTFIFGEDGIVSGSANISSMMYGDVNGDRKVTLTDVSKLLQYIAKWDVKGFNTLAADANGDGKITLTDASRMLQYIAKWDVVLGK